MKKIIYTLISFSTALTAFSADYSITTATETLDVATYLNSTLSAGGEQAIVESRRH